jgi:hypothetical protein
MNQTIVELGCAMLKGQDLPEFLWEHAILHAAYICNSSYTKPWQTLTPFQCWHKKKPDVSQNWCTHRDTAPRAKGNVKNATKVQNETLCGL